MKQQLEIEEGTVAFERCQVAAKAVMNFRKEDLPPDPFGSRKIRTGQKRKKPKAPKG